MFFIRLIDFIYRRTPFLAVFLYFLSSLCEASDQTRGVVVTEQHLASDVGRSILAKGGNAIDAAVAIGYALAVVYPCCGNLGGGGFMLIHLANGKNTLLNFRESAPILATEEMFLDDS